MFNKFTRNHYILIGSLIGFFSTVLFGFVLYSPMLKTIVASQKALKQGNEMRDIYLKLPIPLDFRVYFFNISNPQEVRNGQLPIVEEVGPFCYDAYKEKINVVDNDETDSLTYTPYETYFFNENCSARLSQDDYVTILHPLIVGMVNTVLVEQPRVLSMLNKALIGLFKDKTDIYLTTKVRDILFDGIVIDCTLSKDFAVTAVCSQFKGLSVMTEVTPGVFRFSLFAQRNGSLPTRVTVSRGIKQPKDIGRVLALNNERNLQIWPTYECNAFQGTDGWIFPSFVPAKAPIWTVAGELCRSVKAEYISEAKYRGVDVRHYEANFGDSNRAEERCYCASEDKCVPKGVMDMTKCMKVPLYCTLPHFLGVDEKVAEKVGGMHPDAENHTIKLLFEPVTGTPVLGRRRIQFNLQLQGVKKIDAMKNLTEVLHPILWVEEGVALDGPLFKQITDAFLMLKIATILKLTFLLASIGGICFGTFKILKDGSSTKVNGFKVNNAK